MPEGKAIYAYVDGQKGPLSSQAGGGEGSFNENGYTILPNGLILQWGKVSYCMQDYAGHGYTPPGCIIFDFLGNTKFSSMFSIPFPNKCLSVTTGLSTGDNSVTKILSFSKEKVDFVCTGNLTIGVVNSFYYMAIGY